MKSGIFFLPLIQMAIMFIMSIIGIYTMILVIKALKIYIKNNS